MTAAARNPDALKVTSRRRSPRDLIARVTLVAWISVVLISCDGGAAATGGDNLDNATRLVAEEVSRIGDANSPENGFSSLFRAEVDRDGNIYAYDGMAYEIRVFNPEGTLIRRIGKRGGGPGEFEDGPIYGIKGDTLWTYDFTARRLTLFDRAGAVLSTASTEGARVPAGEGSGYLVPMSMREDGRLISWFGWIGYSENDAHEPVYPTSIPRLLFDEKGTVVDTIGMTPGAPPRMVPPPGATTGRFQRIKVGAQTYTVPDPPGGVPDWQPIEGGHVVMQAPPPASEAATVTVTRYGMNADTIYHRAFNYTAQPYTEEVLDQLATRQPFAIVNGVAQHKPMNPNVVRAIRKEMKFPTHQVPFIRSWIGQDESVWLRREVAQNAPERWIVIDRDGRLRGELELPPKTRPLWSNDDILLAAVPDEDDVPWLVRYQVRPAAD